MKTTPMTDGPLPTFLLLGAMKAGTTSLFQYLAQHPDICVARHKEPHYLAFGDNVLPPGPIHSTFAPIARDLASYRSLFAHWRGQRAIGEASTSSLDTPEAPARAATLVPAARLLVILRQPADRAFSHINLNHRLGREPDLDYRRALHDAATRPPTVPPRIFAYRERGYYLPSLRNWLAHYPRSQLAVLFNDDLDRDPVGTVRAACRHLGVDDRFTPDTSLRFNTSGEARNRMVDFAFQHARFVRRFLERNLPPRLVSALGRQLRHPPRYDPQLRAELTAEYRGEICALGTFVDRDLSAWLEGRKLPPPPDGVLAR